MSRAASVCRDDFQPGITWGEPARLTVDFCRNIFYLFHHPGVTFLDQRSLWLDFFHELFSLGLLNIFGNGSSTDPTLIFGRDNVGINTPFGIMTLFEDPAAKPVYQGRGEARGIKCDVWRQIRMNWPGNVQANTMWRWFFTQKKGEESQPVRPHVNVYTSVLLSRVPYLKLPEFLELGCIPVHWLVSVYQCNFTLDISNLDCVPGRCLVSVYHCSFTLDILNPRGRRCGLVVSALDSGWRGQGSSPGRVIVLCS